MPDKYFPVRSRFFHGDLTHPIHLGLRASIALDLIKTNGVLISARPDGEDTAGRAKVRNADPGELVTYAFDVADCFVSEMERRGECTPLPPDDDKETL